MNDWQRKNCGICEHKRIPDKGYCHLFEDEPEDYCTKVKITPPKDLVSLQGADGHGRPEMVPYPPVRPVS